MSKVLIGRVRGAYLVVLIAVMLGPLARTAAAEILFTFDSDLEGWSTGTTDAGWGTADWRKFCGSDRPVGCVKLDGVGGPNVANAWIYKEIDLPRSADVLEFETTAHNRDLADSFYRVRLIDEGGTEHVLVQWTLTAGAEGTYHWATVTVSIARFAGQRVTLFFEGGDNGPGIHEQRYYDNIRIPDTSFDWTMPPRFWRDDDGDGMIDYFPPDGELEVVPADGWQVDFTVGDPATCDTTRTYAWFVGDVQIARTNACELTHFFPEEGVYPVRLEVSDQNGAPLVLVAQNVTVQDWLIVSIGDSVGSGEGNPDIPGGLSVPSPEWQSRQCHRSAWAGPAQAARLIEEADDKTSVTFIHLACSGATTVAGVLGLYVGQEPGLPLPAQVDDLQALAQGREIDAVFVSVGANDIKFSKVVEDCFLYANCHSEARPLSAATELPANLALLPARYDQVAAALAARQVPADRVYITEYFDPTRDDAGQPCADTILKEPGSPLAFIPNTYGPITDTNISGAEAEWASLTMLSYLNAEVAAGARRAGWTFVGGIYGSFQPHGYCAEDRWVVQMVESLIFQKNRDGTIHPNGAGHSWYGERLHRLVEDDLYPGSDLTNPRVPRP